MNYYHQYIVELSLKSAEESIIKFALPITPVKIRKTIWAYLDIHLYFKVLTALLILCV